MIDIKLEVYKDILIVKLVFDVKCYNSCFCAFSLILCKDIFAEATNVIKNAFIHELRTTHALY